MTATTAPRSLGQLDAAVAPALDRPVRSTRAVARRRRALLQLATRRGEVRLVVEDRSGAPAGAAGVADLLDGLNGEGLLRYGGLRRAQGRAEIIYLPA